MNEEEPVKQKEIQTRTAFTMDMLILEELDILGKFIDNSAVKAEAGNINSLQEWKSGLKQFYRNIKSFLIPKIQDMCEDAFDQLDELLDPLANKIPNTTIEVQKTYKLVGFLTELLFNARNELFMRFVEIINPHTKAEEYSFSAMPTTQKDIIVQKLSGKSGS